MDDTFTPIASEIGDNEYGFMVESFRFRGMPTSSVYISCDVHVALKEDPNANNPVSDFYNHSSDANVTSPPNENSWTIWIIWTKFDIVLVPTTVTIMSNWNTIH